MNKVRLVCTIAAAANYGLVDWEVKDESGAGVSHGVSSSEEWAKHDAGGYHTKDKFDSLYGEGNWEVDFNPQGERTK